MPEKRNLFMGYIFLSDLPAEAVYIGEGRISMDDNSIIQLYWDRDDQAITATAEKYGRYCKAIARNILESEEDAEECVNDTYLGAWNAMPKHWPEELAPFLGKITRNLSFNRYKCNHAQKRGGGEMALVLEELGDCVSDNDDVEQAMDRQELVRVIGEFLMSLSAKKRSIFLRRYWYAESVSEIACDCGMPQNTVSKTLERARKQLRTYLCERGFAL